MKPLEWDTDHLQAFSRSADASPFGPLASSGEICRGAYLYEYTRGGQHALVAVKPLHFSGGSRLEIVALHSDGDRLQALPFYAAVDGIARSHGAQLVACITQRPHIARACERAGFAVSGAVLLKVVNPQ